MDQQVSPAVVVIVLILIVAILVGLYFLVVERKPQPANGEGGAEMMPVDDGDVPPGDEEASGEVADDGAPDEAAGADEGADAEGQEADDAGSDSDEGEDGGGAASGAEDVPEEQ